MNSHVSAPVQVSPQCLATMAEKFEKIPVTDEEYSLLRVRLSAAIEQTYEAVIFADAEGKVAYVNRACERITGISRELSVGRDLDVLLGSGSQTRSEVILPRLRHGESWQVRSRIRKHDGAEYDAAITVVPIPDAVRRVTNFMVLVRDVSRESELERQLLQSQKMEALATLSSEIAHDFNNILQALLGYAELAETEVSAKDPKVAGYITQIRVAGKRASELIGQILAFSRQSEPKRIPLQIQVVAEEVLELLRGSIPSSIEIRPHINHKCGPVEANTTQIHQVLMNLCTNACHSMRQTGGVLDITVDPIDVSAGDRSELSPGPYVRLVVADSGHGMDRATLERIFDPYFTTKASGEGTGLGLATVLGIVRSHGGSISVDSHPHLGTTVTISFPRVRSHSAIPSAANFNMTPLRGAERILLVDDEPAIVQSVKWTLETLGYVVVGFSNWQEAYDTFRESPSLFDLIITDHSMPKITGIELAKAMLEIRPNIPVILCTGYSDVAGSEAAKNVGIRHIVKKPVTREQLAQVIRKAVSSGSQ